MTTQALQALAANLSIPYPAAEAIANAIHLEKAAEIQALQQTLDTTTADFTAYKERAEKALLDTKAAIDDPALNPAATVTRIQEIATPLMPLDKTEEETIRAEIARLQARLQ